MLLDPVWGRRAGHWLKFSTSNHVASVFTSRAHILPPVQGCRTSDGAGLPPQSFVCVIAGGVWRWVPDHPSPSTLIIRSYHGESTRSLPNSEVKHHWACSVLRWGTTRESQVTYVFPTAERSGAAEARWAHNPKVGGSKPPFATFAIPRPH